MGKKFYRCKVCGDIHFGKEGPETCPTCKTVKAYEPVEKESVKEQLGF